MAVALAALKPLEREGTLADRVEEHLRVLLISGRLAPGEKLSLRSVAEALGVSMMPVREAVSRLVADEAIEVTPNRALRVPEMRASQFAELARIRAEIEGFAAASAATSRSNQQLEAIRYAERRFRALAEARKPDASAAVEANQAFHFAVYGASGLLDLVAIIEGLWLRVGPVINLDLRENPERLTRGNAVLLHAECVSAIAKGDAVAARKAVADDITGAAEFILSQGRLQP